MVQKILKRIKTRMTKPARYYDVGGFRLDMGKNHMLSIYQQGSPLFVRFIPYLADLEAKTHGGNGVIVDIGANVGDTVADIVRHTTARIVCVEPTAEFYQLLQKNIYNMGEYGKQILPIQAYISNEKGSFVSDAIGGTAVQRAVATCAEAPTYTLPELLQQQGMPLQDISVIKTSTS